jgi:hypothetical protein
VGARSSSSANPTLGSGTAPSRAAPLPGPARMSGGNSTPRNNNGQRQFTPPSAQQNAPAQQRAQNHQPNTRVQGGPAAQNGQSARGGWQHFSPPTSRSTQPTGPTQAARQYHPPASASSRGGYPSAYNRPPLNMNKPIVQPRGGYPGASRGPYPNGPAGGYRGAPPSPAQRSVPRPSAPPASAAPRGNPGGSSRGSSGGASRGGGGGGGSSHPSSSHPR